jgi:hypothetical protein
VIPGFAPARIRATGSNPGYGTWVSLHSGIPLHRRPLEGAMQKARRGFPPGLPHEFQIMLSCTNFVTGQPKLN